MGPNKILVVEDEREIRELISLHLLRQGFSVQAVGSIEEARKYLSHQSANLLILDWMLPDQSGVEFLKEWRLHKSETTIPVLMVTARAEPEDVVYALDSGADDYIVKPFDAGVLMARVNALIRRTEQKQTPKNFDQKMFQVGRLKVDLNQYMATLDGATLDLTPSEYKILVALMKNTGRVLTRDKLIQEVQGEGVNVVGRTIDTHMFALRKKLNACSEYIETIRGVGYRFREVSL